MTNTAPLIFPCPCVQSMRHSAHTRATLCVQLANPHGVPDPLPLAWRMRFNSHRFRCVVISGTYYQHISHQPIITRVSTQTVPHHPSPRYTFPAYPPAASTGKLPEAIVRISVRTTESGRVCNVPQRKCCNDTARWIKFSGASCYSSCLTYVVKLAMPQVHAIFHDHQLQNPQTISSFRDCFRCTRAFSDTWTLTEGIKSRLVSDQDQRRDGSTR